MSLLCNDMNLQIMNYCTSIEVSFKMPSNARSPTHDKHWDII